MVAGNMVREKRQGWVMGMESDGDITATRAGAGCIMVAVAVAIMIAAVITAVGCTTDMALES